jgi:hypothetical protein
MIKVIIDYCVACVYIYVVLDQIILSKASNESKRLFILVFTFEIKMTNTFLENNYI